MQQRESIWCPHEVWACTGYRLRRAAKRCNRWCGSRMARALLLLLLRPSPSSSPPSSSLHLLSSSALYTKRASLQFLSLSLLLLLSLVLYFAYSFLPLLFIRPPLSLASLCLLFFFSLARSAFASCSSCFTSSRLALILRYIAFLFRVRVTLFLSISLSCFAPFVPLDLLSLSFSSNLASTFSISLPP